MVSEYVEDLNYAFDIKNEIISFENPQELQLKLKDPIISAEAAMYKVQQSHTYKNRIETVVDLLLQA